MFFFKNVCTFISTPPPSSFHFSQPPFFIGRREKRRCGCHGRITLVFPELEEEIQHKNASRHFELQERKHDLLTNDQIKTKKDDIVTLIHEIKPVFKYFQVMI